MPALEEWFCAICGRVSDHLVHEDAKGEMDCSSASRRFSPPKRYLDSFLYPDLSLPIGQLPRSPFLESSGLATILGPSHGGSNRNAERRHFPEIMNRSRAVRTASAERSLRGQQVSAVSFFQVARP